MDAYDFESVTVANTAIGLTSSKYYPTDAPMARSVIITVETAQIRFRMDGTNPTATEGHIAEIGDAITISGIVNIKNFRAIRTTSTSATIKVSYLR